MKFSITLNSSFKNIFTILIISLILTFNPTKVFAGGQLTIDNINFINDYAVEFDVFLQSDSETFELTSYQCTFSFNQQILNSGSLTFELINNSSELTNSPISPCVISENDDDKYLAFASVFGTDSISSTPSKIGSFRLTNTAAFSHFSTDFYWHKATHPQTILMGAAAVDLTSQFTFASYDVLLPVELTSFSAVTDPDGILLQWSTATELNNLGFEIERSNKNKNKDLDDGTEGWQAIGFVDGYGTSSEMHSYQFVDNSIQNNTTYNYRLKQIDADGTYEYSSVVEVHFAKDLSYELEQNYPNPFNPSTKIKFSIPTGYENVRSVLKIYDVLGNEVATLMDEQKSSGTYEVDFNASNLASGIYIYTLSSGDFSSTKKMMLLK